MLDSARHYQSPADIERFIDWMALHKLNVLHWHLTDDQAWRLEIRRYPRLTEVGAWRVPAGAAARTDIDQATGQPRLYGGYYSQDTVRRLARYAAARNVTIVPEIEMPGHATAALVAYPELAAGEVPAAVPADWGIYPNLFDVDETTFAFLEHVLVEVIELFPSAYVHIGGDEVVKDQWRTSARTQRWMRERGISDVDELHGHFIARIGRFLSSRGRRLVGWDEILEEALPPEATAAARHGVGGLAHAVFRQPPGDGCGGASRARTADRARGCLRVRPDHCGTDASRTATRARFAGEHLDGAHPHGRARGLDGYSTGGCGGGARLVTAG